MNSATFKIDVKKKFPQIRNVDPHFRGYLV
jgi:hypothetical protein